MKGVHMAEKILITGGAGFIGCHAVKYFAEAGYQVVVLDNLSRKGTTDNADWLKKRFPITLYRTDVRDFKKLQEVFAREKPFAAVLHLAAQVAVTTSVADPRDDFEINALGTFNLLECFRTYCPDALFMYASTNKVYGNLGGAAISEQNGRYRFRDIDAVTESQCLDFHSPYGCSKGSADQYVIDYARIYDLRTVCFRQSCIYGTRQFGVEDQGWVAWFVIAGVLGLPATIYGDGKQVRDILFVDDLIRLYALAIRKKDLLRGEAFNIGGGPDNTLSLLELIDMLRQNGLALPCDFSNWRPGDQRVFISDNTKAQTVLDWKPMVSPRQGTEKLLGWVKENQPLLKKILTG